MQFLKATVVLGALLSAGMLMAQQPDPNQAPPPPQAAPQAAPMQHGMRHAPNPNKQARRLGRELGLTRGQVAQIKPIFAERYQQMQSVRDNNTLNPQDRRAQMRQIMRDSNARVEAVLSDSQRQQYEQILAQRRGRRSPTAQQPPQG